MKKTASKTVTGIILLLLIALTISGGFDSVIDRAFMGRIREHNMEYLNSSFERSVKGFLILSAIKAGLAVVEGSDLELGFSLGAQGSMELQYGDVVQSMYDYVDVAWKTSLAGGAILLLTRLLTELVTHFDQWFLTAALILLFIYHAVCFFFPRQKIFAGISRQAFFLLIVPTIVLYLVLPITIAGASFLSARISGPLIEEATEGYRSIEKDLTHEALTERVSPFGMDEQEDGGFWSRLKVSERIEKLKQKYGETVSWFREKTGEMAVWTIKLFAGYLFDCVVFPLALFFVLFVAARGLLKYAFNIQRDSRLRDDLRDLMEQYYSRKEERVED